MSQPSPAPIPMVDMLSSFVIIWATSRGTSSSTIANAPASSSNLYVLDQPFRLFGGTALDAVTAHLIDRLRRQPDMGDNRNLFVNEPPDQIDAVTSALQLDRFSAPPYFIKRSAFLTLSSSFM